MEAISGDVYYLGINIGLTSPSSGKEQESQINLKNHCLICLQPQELKTLLEVTGRGAKLTRDFTPIIHYLTGTDPTHDSWQIASELLNQEEIPPIKSLPPLCPPCFSTLVRLHGLHEKLLGIQGLIQKQTEFARHLVTKTIQSSSMFLSTREIFQSKASDVTYNFVESLHDKIIRAGNNKVKYPTRVPPDYAPQLITQAALVPKSVPLTVNLLCMRSDEGNPEVNGGQPQRSLSFTHHPVDNMTSISLQTSNAAPLGMGQPGFERDPGNREEHAESTGALSGTRNEYLDIAVAFPPETEQADYEKDAADEREYSEEFGPDEIGTGDVVTDMWFPLDASTEAEPEVVVENWNQQDTKRRRLECRAVSESVPTTGNLLRIRCDYGSTSEISGDQPQSSANFTIHPVVNTASMSSHHSFAVPLEMEQPDYEEETDDERDHEVEFGSDDMEMETCDKVMDISFPLNVSNEAETEVVVPISDLQNTKKRRLECDVPKPVDEVLAQLDADGLIIKGSNPSWQYMIQRALSISNDAGEEEFVAGIKYARITNTKKGQRQKTEPISNEEIISDEERHRLPRDVMNPTCSTASGLNFQQGDTTCTGIAQENQQQKQQPEAVNNVSPFSDGNRIATSTMVKIGTLMQSIENDLNPAGSHQQQDVSMSLQYIEELAVLAERNVNVINSDAETSSTDSELTREEFQRLVSKSIVIENNTTAWKAMVDSAYSLSSQAGEEEIEQFVRKIKICANKKDGCNVYHQENSLWKREKVCRMLKMRNLPETFVQNLRQKLVERTPVPDVNIKDGLTGEDRMFADQCHSAIHKVSQKLAFDAGTPMWRRIIRAGMLIKNTSDEAELNKFVNDLRSREYWKYLVDNDPFKSGLVDVNKRTNECSTRVRNIPHVQAKICTVLNSLKPFPGKSILYIQHELGKPARNTGKCFPK